MKSSLIQLLKNSRFIESLRGDPSYDRTPRPMRDSFYSLVEPDRVPQPQLLSVSGEMLEELCLSAPLSQEDIDILSGNRISQARPYASCYGGHQFGHWAGQLGDGRAINLGEISGNNQMWELQLKGSGLTPFSRTADGKAVLRSSVREFLMSEAMYHLGVPTTRALSLIQTGEAVLRDLLYDGHPAYEPGAIVCRVAPSFLRFGHFEILAARDEKENLRQLIDFTIANFFPEIDPQNPKALVSLFKEVQSRSIQMVID
ncbi:MAG: YdiU family protein, partial [Bdellovibrionales bacterium]|nr:YdiU family protein [Bdellovibrionales bacterium]